MRPWNRPKLARGWAPGKGGMLARSVGGRGWVGLEGRAGPIWGDFTAWGRPAGSVENREKSMFFSGSRQWSRPKLAPGWELTHGIFIGQWSKAICISSNKGEKSRVCLLFCFGVLLFGFFRRLVDDDPF